MKAILALGAVFASLGALMLTGCHEHAEATELEPFKIVSTSPQSRDVVLTQQYVCQIHSRRHIEVCALEGGYLQAVQINEGQAVKHGDMMFKITPTLYQARLDAENAEAKLAELELNNTTRLLQNHVVSENEVALYKAKLAKAVAKADQAKAELNFTDVKAPFDGIVDRLHEQLGSLVAEGDVLTTLSDNSVMWVYFNVPEAAYLEYVAQRDQHGEAPEIELVLANGEKFSQRGKIGAVEAQFNNETGNISFRADFDNPQHLLRHGQTGNILIHRVSSNALVIPQRATFEVLDKKYVFVVDKDHVAHQREIKIKNELEDVYLIQDGLAATDKIILDGVQQVSDGEKVTAEFRAPEQVMDNQKYAAE